MTNSISMGFIRQAKKDVEAQQSQLDERSEQVRKSILDFNKKFVKSIETANKLIDSLDDNKAKKALENSVKKAEKIAGIRKRLEKKGASISEKEAQEFINTAEQVIKEVDKQQGVSRAASTLSTNVRDFFVSNAEKISQSGLTDEASTVALRAASPEAAFVTEALGFSLGDAFTSLGGFFSGDRNKGNDGDDVDALLDGVESRIRDNNEEIVVADNQRNEKNLEVKAEQHDEVLAALDDVEDRISLSSSASSFIQGATATQAPSLIKNIGSALGTLITPLLMLGKILGKGSAIGIALSGIAFLGKVLIDSLSDSQIASIKSTVDNITTFAADILGEGFEVIASGLSKATSFVSENLGPAIGFLKDAFGPAISEFFSLGKTVFNTVVTAGQELGGVLASAAETLTPVFETISSSISSALEFIGPVVKETIPKIGTFFKEFFLGSILVFGDALEFTFSTINKIFTKIVETVSGIGEFFRDKISGVTDFFGIGQDEPIQAAAIAEPTIFGFVKDVAARTFDFDTDNINVNPALPTSNELEAGINQAQISNTILSNADRQERIQKEQTKETIKILTKTEEKKQKSSYQGRRSLDNSPVVSDDIGLVYTLGGG